jgi:hypothetical protein
MRRQSRTGGANSPDVTRKPLGERIHKLLVLGSRTRWRRSDRRGLLPRRLLDNKLLTVLRLLIPVICTIRRPTQIGVCRIDGGLDVIVGNCSIYEFSKRSGSYRPDGAGA